MRKLTPENISEGYSGLRIAQAFEVVEREVFSVDVGELIN